MGVRSRALARNEAIWSRFTGSLGQYRLLVGGLHPFGDTGGSQPVDVGFVDAAFVVGEQVIFRAGD